jgi:hypothetical protein
MHRSGLRFFSFSRVELDLGRKGDSFMTADADADADADDKTG